ncbi:MAG TPA: hypothetical protein ENI76_09625 [Ignavibacteria bacterium]|nr:hypothetical protein [Ignavibacteria bacterium]
MPQIRAITINGKLIEKAKWEVNTISNMREGQSLQISITVNDDKLINLCGKQNSIDCVIEKEEDGSHYVVLTMKIMSFRHMLDHSTSELDSQVYLSPINRAVEEILTFLLDKEKCNPKFIEILKQM